MASSTVCRNLFGSVDHALLQEELGKRMEQTMEDDRRRWNFDFLSHTPLPGGFEWEETSAASFYQEENQEDGPGAGQEKLPNTYSRNQENLSKVSHENQENASNKNQENIIFNKNQENASITDQENIIFNKNQENVSITCSRNQENQERVFTVSIKPVTMVCRKRRLETRGNTRITDFFPKRRKSTESRSVLTQINSAEAALRKTIR